jgi:hypothetical protein
VTGSAGGKSAGQEIPFAGVRMELGVKSPFASFGSDRTYCLIPHRMEQARASQLRVCEV